MNTSSREHRPINDPRECCICFEDVERHVVQTGCGHVNHFQCLNGWLTSNNDEGSSSNEGTSCVEIIQNMIEEEELAHVIDLTREAIRPNNKVFPMCKEVIDQEALINYVDYKNKFAKLDTDGLTEDVKNAVKKRKRANQKRAERRKRNKGNTRNIEQNKVECFEGFWIFSQLVSEASSKTTAVGLLLCWDRFIKKIKLFQTRSRVRDDSLKNLPIIPHITCALFIGQFDVNL